LANIHIRERRILFLRQYMNKNRIIQKVAALVMVLTGLLSMLVAWQLLLVSEIHSSTVVVLEMGGVVVCMAGYFLWRHVRVAENAAKGQIQEVPSADEDDQQE
jgi:cobalamin biosynthesis protein CobD/CbiB